MDLPRHYTIRESSHRIHNPFTSDKLATLGEALNPPPGTAMLDLAAGPARCCVLNMRRWLDDHLRHEAFVNPAKIS